MFVFPQFALLLGITSVMLDFVMLIYTQYFGKFLPINKNKTIESVLAGSKLH